MCATSRALNSFQYLLQPHHLFNSCQFVRFSSSPNSLAGVCGLATQAAWIRCPAKALLPGQKGILKRDIFLENPTPRFYLPCPLSVLVGNNRVYRGYLVTLVMALPSNIITPPNRKGNIRYALQRERDTIPRYDDEMTEGGRGSASQIYIRLVHSCTTPNILSGFNC